MNESKEKHMGGVGGREGKGAWPNYIIFCRIYYILQKYLLLQSPAWRCHGHVRNVSRELRMSLTA